MIFYFSISNPNYCMSELKIHIKVGIVEFSGEGNQGWLSTQLDKILAKVPELVKIELTTAAGASDTNKNGNPKSDQKTNKTSNLASYLKEKNATSNQVKKFLA